MDERSSTAEDARAESASLLNSPSRQRSLKFPKSSRLINKKDFARVLRARNRFLGRFVAIDYNRRGEAFSPKLGITASRRYGKAHLRNRFKRVVREAFRLLYAEFPPGLELNVSPLARTQNFSRAMVIEDLTLFLSKLENYDISKP